MKNALYTAITSLALLFTGHAATAQGVAINTTGATANSSSIMDVSSTTQGMLIPRMTAAQRTAIASPATGLLVYQTDGTPGFYFYQGGWTILGGGSPTGTAGGGLTGTYPSPTIANGAVGTGQLSATGTASGSTFLRGDNTWATPSSSPTGSAGGGLAGSYPNPTIATGSVGIAQHSATGTASGSTFLRGDNTWAAPITLTTTGSGAATFSSGTLNIPTPAGGGNGSYYWGSAQNPGSVSSNWYFQFASSAGSGSATTLTPAMEGIVPAAMTVDAFTMALILSSGSGTDNITVSLVKNGVTQSMSATGTSSATVGARVTFTSTGGPISFAAGDRINYVLSNTNSTPVVLVKMAAHAQ